VVTWWKGCRIARMLRHTDGKKHDTIIFGKLLGVGPRPCEYNTYSVTPYAIYVCLQICMEMNTKDLCTMLKIICSYNCQKWKITRCH
jgi:hypothetical protein